MPISRLINACKRHRRYFIAVATRKTVFSYPETKTYFAGKSNAGIRFSDLCRGGPLVGVCWLARARSAADNRKKTLLAPVSRVFHVLRPARFPRSKARPILLSSTRVGFFSFRFFWWFSFGFVLVLPQRIYVHARWGDVFVLYTRLLRIITCTRGPIATLLLTLFVVRGVNNRRLFVRKRIHLLRCNRNCSPRTLDSKLFPYISRSIRVHVRN